MKPDPKLRLATGAKGFLKMGGVGGGRVLVWETIKDRAVPEVGLLGLTILVFRPHNPSD